MVCANYPQCDFVSWDMPIEEKCPVCGSYMVLNVAEARQYIKNVVMNSVLLIKKAEKTKAIPGKKKNGRYEY